MGKIAKKINNLNDAKFISQPPFPKNINVELINVCNHKCNFCAYQFMNRKAGNIDTKSLEKWLLEAYDLGAREIGLHSGTEPLASKYLEYFIMFSKKIGYEYTYISTNGTLASTERIRRIVDSGIDSIKFSINAGTKEMYKKVHGKDQFDIAIRNLIEVSKYRKRLKPYLAVSFVETEQNKSTLVDLKKLTQKYIDEFVVIKQKNQSGQMVKTNDEKMIKIKKCGIPFNKVNISMEGYLRVCCNDYENLLAVVDLKKTNSLKDAFYSKPMKDFRQRHLSNNLKGTLCYNCLYNTNEPVKPLNLSLTPFWSV